MTGPKHLITFVVVICMCINLLSQTDQSFFTQLTTMHGLSSNTVTAIYQDHQGFMWIKTRKGLERYDGIEFINHKTFPEGQIETGTFIVEDSLGNLWFNRVLTKYNLADGSHQSPHFTYLSENKQIQGIVTAQMGPDHRLYLAAVRNVWIIDPYDPDSLAEWAFPKFRALPFDNFTTLRFDSRDQLWIGSSDGLFRYEQENIQLLPFEGIEYPENKHVNDFIFDSDGNLWIAFYYYLVRYDFESQTAEYFKSPYFTSKIHQSSNGNILIGTQKGLYYLEPGQHEIKEQLPNVFVTSIYEDRAHNLWIGTYYDGVFVGNADFNPTQILALNIGNQRLSDYRVNRIIADSDRGLWIHEWDQGLLYHNLLTGKTRVIDPEPGIAGMVYFSSKDQFWYCVNNELICYHTDDASFRRLKMPRFVYDDEMDRGKQKPSIRAYGDILLVNSPKNGIYYFDPESEQFSLFTRNDSAANIAEVIDGKRYRGLDSRAILVMDSAERNYEMLAFKKDVIVSMGLSETVLYKDKSDTLWLGGWGGLCRLNEQSSLFEMAFDFHYANLIVRNILEDSHGNLWIGTTGGLYKYIRQSGHFMILGPRQGLPQGRNWVGSSTQTADGQMFFSIEGSIIHFQPDAIPANASIPPVVLTGFKVLPKLERSRGNTEQDYHTLINTGKEIDLKYWQNSFTVQFASLNYISPEDNQYRYRLRGLEDEWNSVGNQSRATYTSLGKGNYTFEVMGSNNEGIWNEDPCQLFIHVDPLPWWSWWSITLYVLIVFGVILTIYRYNIRRLRLQHQLELKSKESQSLKEIDRAKSQFFTNISHEFRTPLSLILDPAEQLFHDKQITPKQKRFVRLILNNSKRLLFLTNQILDLAKLDNKRIKLKVEETDLRELIKPTAQAFKSGAEALGLTYRILLPDKPVMVWVDRERIEQVVVNLLSNAFKFCTRGEVIIELSEADDAAWIHVGDTGIGIPADQIDHIFDNYYQVERGETKHLAGTGIGLYLVKELVTLHHGTVQVKSEVNIGSTFSVRLLKGNKHFRPGQFASNSHPEEEDENPPDAMVDPVKGSGMIIPDHSDPGVLVIEDNPEMLKYLEEVLSEEYTVQIARDGEEGFRMSLELNPDVVISDVMMPVMDGYVFCEKMKKDVRTSHIPVILLTAKSMHKDKINGLQLGADDYLQKPFHMDELKLRIRYHLELRKKIHKEFLRNFKISSEIEMALTVDDKLLRNVFAQIEEHLHDDQFGVEKLSRLAGMSRKHLNNKIKSLTNQTTNELIRGFRLRKAAHLLSDKGLTVSEACYQVGFNNLSYFSKCFAEFYGIRPSEYGR